MNYEAIQSHIARARIERSAELGEIIAEAIVKSWRSIQRGIEFLRAANDTQTDYLPRSQA